MYEHFSLEMFQEERSKWSLPKKSPKMPCFGAKIQEHVLLVSKHFEQKNLLRPVKVGFFAQNILWLKVCIPGFLPQNKVFQEIF